MGQVVPGAADYPFPSILQPFNLEWHAPEEGESYFKSAAGSGFVKGGFLLGAPPTLLPYYTNVWGPFISIGFGAGGDSTATLDPTCDDNPFMTDLVGETVTGCLAAPFTITAPMFNSAVTLTGSGYPTGPISAIGLMTPV
jgi:hypothetical protein